MTAFNERVGANIKQIRGTAGLSQSDLARELASRGHPFQQQTILKVEKGIRPLRLEEAHAIADVLGIDPALLVDCTEYGHQAQAAVKAASMRRAQEAAVTRRQPEPTDVDWNDPHNRDGLQQPAYRPGFPDTWWKVEGWNDMPKGGACCYENQPNKEAAMEAAKRYRREGDEEGRKYDHYAVVELEFNVTVVQTTHDLPSDEDAE